MPPLLLLLLLVLLTAVAVLTSAMMRKAASARVAALAASWKMRFTPVDRFQLTRNIATHFPIPGAADVVIRDLVYGEDASAAGLRYFFTIEYTLGILRTKRRRVSAGTLIEAPGTDADRLSAITLAPAKLPLLEQYEWLRQPPTLPAAPQ
jgi:hypothetical protein